MVATEAGSTHPTGILSCVMLPRNTSTRNTGHRTIPVLVFVTRRCCSYRRKSTSTCTRTMFWASYQPMVSGRSTDGQGQSKVLLPPENVVCGKVMFSVVSVYQFVREECPYTRPPSKSPGPKYPSLYKALIPDTPTCVIPWTPDTPPCVRPWTRHPSCVRPWT